jgi:hypothetical protein
LKCNSRELNLRASEQHNGVSMSASTMEASTSTNSRLDNDNAAVRGNVLNTRQEPIRNTSSAAGPSHMATLVSLLQINSPSLHDRAGAVAFWGDLTCHLVPRRWSNVQIEKVSLPPWPPSSMAWAATSSPLSSSQLRCAASLHTSLPCPHLPLQFFLGRAVPCLKSLSIFGGP